MPATAQTTRQGPAVPRQQVQQAQPPAPRRPARRLGLPLRTGLAALAVPALVAVLLPHVVGDGLGDLGGGPALLVVPLVLLVTAVAVLRLRPPADELDVHDRQLDVIVAVPALLSAGWLVWLDHTTGAEEPTLRTLVAVVLAGLGTASLLTGVRACVRLSPAALALLTLQPVLDGQGPSPVTVGGLAFAAALGARALLRSSRP